MPILCQEYMLFFLFAIEYSAKAQPPQHTTTGAPPPLTPVPLLLCAEEVEPWLNTQWQTEKIAYTLGRGWASIFDMSSTSGYMGEKYFQEFGPRVFDMSSASGYMGEKYFSGIWPQISWRIPLGAYPLMRSIQGKGFLHVAIYIC